MASQHRASNGGDATRARHLPVAFRATPPTAAMEDRDINMMDAAPDVTAGKRKADDATPAPKKQAKKERAPGALVTLRNTRLALQQRAVHWDRTMPVLRGA